MSPTLPFASRLRPSLERTGDTITIERLPVDEGGLIVASRRTDGELVCIHPVPDGLTPADWASSIAAEYPGWTVISEHVADDYFHLAYIPLGGPIRPQCPGSGPTTMRHADVTCPDCLAVIAKIRARAEAAEAAEKAELHDADTVGDELIPGETYFDLHGNRLFAIGGGMLNAPVELVRSDGQIVKSDQLRGPLTRARMVPADSSTDDAPPSAWMDREPVEDPEPHCVYVTEAGVILVAVGPPNLVTLYDAEGNAHWPQDVRPLRPAATIPAGLAEALEMEEALESLTGIRRVPADAIVLERPTGNPPVNFAVHDGQVVYVTNCAECGLSEAFRRTPSDAREHAAHWVTLADAAERRRG